MSLLVPIAVFVICALWIKGLKSAWSRAALLACLLGLLGILLPSLSADRTQADFAIYQQESIAFAKSVSSSLAQGDSRAAQAMLDYFAGHQDWKTVSDSKEMAAFFKAAAQQTPSAAAATAEPSSSPSTQHQAQSANSN